MGEWLIYGSNGTQKATVKKLEYSGEFMGETSVTCDIYSPSPISFSIGDYLVYRGERFTIDYDATRLKQARNNTYGKGYTYENMRFLSYVGELKKCEFLDFVPSDNLIHFSQLPDFSFYAETVKDLADRLQANLDRIYTGGKAWTVQVVQGFEGKENINVSVSKSTCFDALRMAYEQFEATFIIRGRTITIGTAGNELETDFRYGKGNGLKTIERSVDESDAIVTRLRAYGNTTNMPANYYKNIGMRVYAPIYEIYHVSSTGCDIHFVPKLKNACFNDKNGQYNYWVSVSLDETLWLKAVASPNTHLSSTNYSVVTVGLYDGNTQAMVTQFNTQLQSGTYNRLYFKQGINVGAWPIEYREYAENVPDLMAIDRLMLPGFPELTTDPYIDSSNIATLGVREKSVYFDGSDPDTPDIHPTLEGMTAAELRAAGYVIDLDSGDNGNLDEIAADATEIDGSPITADGAFEGVDEVPGFKVTIKDIGFDINDYLSTETATLVMKTGMCGGMEFTIVKVDKVGNKYVLECQRTEDVAHYFPYNPYLIKAGDKFVLTNLEMPKAYIDAASQRLLNAAQEYIAKYSEPQWVYAIKMDDIWMQKQRDNSVSEASSYYWNIKEGDVMNVTDSDLGVDITEVIDRLSIREGFGPIPEFEVVLRKEKPQGTIGVLQNRIRQLELRNAEQVSTIYRQQNYIDLIIGDKINDIQNQLDHVQVTYFGDYAPTLSNEPASTWQSSEYSEHDGDMFYNRTTGKGYEFTYQNGTWGWIEIQDEDIRQALEEAAAAQDTADGKRRVFVTPAGTLPTPPYDENDLWVNATYPSNSTSTDESQHKYYNDILKCVTPKAEGGTASINDWTLASKYTDDSSLNAFINGSYADDLEDIQTQLDGKAETWYQSTDPSTAWTTTALKNQHKGDIWHNSSNTTINGVKAGQDAIWNGTAWAVDETVPQSVYDTIDGKAAIYVTWGAWGNDLQVKDLFIPSANTTQGGVTYKANKVYRCTNKSTPTFQEIAYTDDAALNAFLNGYTGTLTGIRTDISNAQTTANNANTAAAAAQATADALDYLKQAYSADNTLIDHGLILSTIVALRDSSNNVWSGISGAYDSTKLGNGIAAWYGGGMIDKEVSAVSNAAKSLFRFDGSGYVASGNLKWDASGNVTIQGYSINATTLQVGGANVATQAMLDNFVSKAFFNRLFTAYDANGNAIVPNNTTTAINNLKIMVGAWTEQYLSALGLNSEGGGGGTGDVSHIKIGTNPDVFLDPDEDGIIDMSSYAANWNDAFQKRHTHSNKSVLDGITSTKVSHWDAVYGVVPQAAYESGNSLADKNFVNSSISTATATFRGTVTASNDTDAAAATALATITTKDLNDYAFVKVENTPQTGVDKYKRYKYDGSSWVYEYTLNNSSFTSDQWNAINSGITTSLVTKLNGIASGAQVNVIETVKVNGTALTVTSKAVDITAVPLSIITGADDLKAIEGLSGTGFLKRTGNNAWALDTTVVLNTRTITAGNGLTGGGDLSANRTINVASANAAITVNADNIQLNVINDYTTTTNNTIIPLAAARGKDLNDRLAILESWFEADADGNIKTKDKPNNGGHRGFYTESFVSALGQNSQGGGGGDFSEEQMWAALQANTGTYENAKINWNHIPLATTSTAGAIKVGSTLAISNGILNQATIPNLTADVYTKVTVDTYGRVTQGGDLLADDIPTLSMSKISGLSTALGNVYTKTESDAKYVTALGTSGNYLTYTKNGNSNSITVPYASFGNSLMNIYTDSSRATTANLTHISNGGVQHFKATSTMREDKPANDGHILHFHWDNSAGWDSQLFLSNDPAKPYLQYRAKNGNSGVWGSWITVLDTNNTSLSNGVININGSTITPLTAASNLAWSKVTGTPTTLSGYGITDAYTKTEADNKYVTIATAQTITGAKTFSDVIKQKKGVLDNTPYQNLITLYSQNNTESTGDAWENTYPSYGIGFGRYWNSSDYGGVVTAGIYATVSGGWRGGLIFRTSYGGSATTANYVNALRLAPSGATYFANKVYVGSELHVTGSLFFDTNYRRIYFKNTNNNDVNVVEFSDTNNLHLGYGVGGNGNDTAIYGNSIFLKYGTSRTTGLTLSNAGNVTIANALYVTNGITLTTTKKIYFGDSSHYLELDANGYFHFSHGLYSDSFVSALGSNSQGGGGGDASLNAVWGSLTTYNDEYKDEVIDVHHIPNLSWSKITSNKPTTLSGYGILDAYTKTQADAKYATISSLSDYATQSWVNTQLGGYLPLTGGITTGIIFRKMTADTSNYEDAIGWVNRSNEKIASIGYFNTVQRIFLNPIGASDPWNNAEGKYNLVVGNNLLTYNTYPILHSNNYTSYTVTKTGTGASGTWGISISGSAAKLGTTTVGSSTVPIYLNGGVPTASTAKFIFSGDVLQTTNPFTPLKKLYISKIDNSFYAAEKRFTVTGEIIDGSTTTEIPQSTLHNLFDGSYETQLNITNNKTAKIHIRFDGYSGSAFPGYPYGYMFLSFYHVCKPTSVSARCYCNHEPQGIGWHDMSVVNYSGGNCASYLYGVRNDLYAIQEFEFTIVGDTTNSYGYTSLTQIEMNLDRPAPERTPFLSKYAAETLYYPLTIESSLNVTEGVVLNNNKAIFFKDASGAGRNTLYFDTNNNLALGYGTAGAGYNTYIDGNNITLRYGINHATGLVLASDGNVRIPNTLSVDGTITNKYLAIAESWTDTWSDGTHTHPWYGIDGRWHNTGAYSTTISDYYGITLKTYKGNISIRNNGNVGIGTFDPSYKLHVNGYTSTTRLYLSSSVYLEYDSTNGGVHLVGAGLYSDSYISALGANSQGGGGSTFDEEQMWQALDATNEVINTSHIPDISAVYGYAKQSWVTGQNYATQTWVNNKGYITSSALDGYATQTWVNQQGFVKSSGVTSVATGSGLTGGTITSTGTISIVSGFSSWANALGTWGTLKTANGYTSALQWKTSDGGEMSFAYKGGQISAQLDGYFYQNEGAYRVVDTSDLASGKSWGMSITGNAATATKLGTSTIGSSVRPIYLNNGVPTQVTSLDGALVGGYIGHSEYGYLVTHPESTGGVIIPYIYNDLAFLTSQGGSCTIYSTTETDLTKDALTVKTDWSNISGLANIFDGSPTYWNGGNNNAAAMNADGLIIDITLPNLKSYGNKFYIDFGNTSWGYSNIDILLKNSANDTNYVSKVSGGVINEKAEYYANISHYSTPQGGGSSVSGFDRMRIHLYGRSSTGGVRIAQIGLIQYNSLGQRYTSMSRGYDDYVYRSITPNTTSTYSLGTSAKRWNNIYGTTLNATTGAFSSNVTIDGKLGIGISPTSKLHVNGTGLFESGVELKAYLTLDAYNDTYGSGNVRIYYDANNTRIVTTAANLLFSGHIIPNSTNGSYNLGTSYFKWGHLYINSIHIGDATLSWDSTNQMLKVDKGIYSTGAVSALGANDEGGGSSDFSEDLMWAALRSNTGTYANAKIDANHIPDTSSLYGYLKSSSLSGYVNAVSTSGSGNAVTSVTKSGNTITFTKGSTFLTSHQTLYTLSIYGGTTKVLDFKPNANASIYIKAGGDISLTNDTTNKYITLSYTHPTNGANTTISAADGKVLSAITVNSLGHVTSVSSKTLASADIPDLSSTYATAARATTLEGYFTDGVANNAAKLNGQAASYYATASSVTTLQGYFTSGAANNAVTTADTTNTLYVVGVTSSATTTLKRDTSITVKGNALSVGSINASDTVRVAKNAAEQVFFTAANSTGSVQLLVGATGNRGVYDVTNTTWIIATNGTNTWLSQGNVGIGITNPTYKLHVSGTLGVTSNTTISGNLSVSGNSSLDGTLSVANAVTLSGNTAAKKRIYFGDTSHYLELDSTGFHFVGAGVYSDSFMSALGANSSGGGGDFDEDSMWAALDATNEVIGSAHIPNLSWNKITSNKPTTLSGYGITNAYTKTQVDNALSGYLPLSGGTITGTLTVQSSFYVKTITEPNGGNGLLAYQPSSGWGGISSTQWGVGATDSQGVIRSSNADLIHYKGGTNYTILDSSNHGDYAYALYGGTAITGTSSSHYDLDTLIDVGSYYCTANVIAQYFDNKPTNDNYAFRVWISAPTGTSSSYVRQRFQYYNRMTIYERISTSDSGISWGDWYLVQDDLTNYALASSLDGYLPLSGGTLTGNLKVATGYGISDATGNGLLVFKPATTWGGISSNQWGVGAGDVQGVIRSGNYNLLHYNSGTGTSSTILDSNNTNVVDGVGYINGTAITAISGNAGTATELATSRSIWGQFFNGSASVDGDLFLLSGAEGANINTASAKLKFNSLYADSTNIYRSPYIQALGGSSYGRKRLGFFQSNATNYTDDFVEAMSILPTGNVGIGNTSPAYKLDVSGQGSFSNSTYDVLHVTRTNTAYSAAIVFHNSTDGEIGILSVYGSGNSASDNYNVGGTLRFRPKGGSSDYAVMHNGLTQFNTAIVNGSYGAMDTRGSTFCYLQSDYTAGWANGMYAVNGSGTILGSAVGIHGNSSGIIHYYYGGTYDAPKMVIMPSGNVGIGTKTPGYKLGVVGTVGISGGHLYLTGASTTSSTANTTQIIFTASSTQQVAISSNSSALIINPTSSTTTKQIVLGVGSVASSFGNSITCSGEVTASSDGRKKNIISNTKFNVRDIASARSVLFEWNDGRDDDMEKKIHGGSIAQDWLGKADSFLSQDNDGWYSINYGALALCSAITIAREVVKHSDEIDRLKQEVSYLKARVAELEERRA